MAKGRLDRYLLPLVTDPDEDLSWQQRGKCHNQNLNDWFPVPEESFHGAVCAGCTEQEPCLEYAIRHRMMFGIWGGKTTSQRHKIAKQAAALERAITDHEGDTCDALGTEETEDR